MYSNALQNIADKARLRTSEANRDYLLETGPGKMANTGLSAINTMLRTGGKTKRAAQRYASRPRTLEDIQVVKHDAQGNDSGSWTHFQDVAKGVNKGTRSFDQVSNTFKNLSNKEKYYER